MRFAALSQSTNLVLIGRKETAVDEFFQRGSRTARDVHQLVASHVLAPLGHRRQHLALRRTVLQNVEGDVQRPLVTHPVGQSDKSLRLRRIALLRLQAGGQGCLVDFADGRHVVARYPLPQLQLPRQHHRLLVGQLNDGLHLEVGLLVVHTKGNAHVSLARAKRHQHAHSRLHPVGLFVGQRVGERAVERHRQYHFNISHTNAKIQFSFPTPK